MKGIAGFSFDGKRKRARFEVIVPGTGSKERRRKWVAAKTSDEALEKWKAFRKEVLAPLVKETPKTFRWYIDTYWTAIRARNSGSTAETDGQVIRRRLLPFFGDVELAKINLALVRDFVGQMKRDGYSHDVTFTMREKQHRRLIEGTYSPATINGTLRVLSKILRDAEAREVLDRYPIKGRLPREKEVALELEFRGDEMTRFLGAFDDEPAFRRNVDETRATGKPLASNAGRRAAHVTGSGRRGDSEWTGEAFKRFRWSRPLFVVALETGFAKTDLLNLRWSDVDESRGVIRLPRQKTKVVAALPVSPACAAALEDCKARPLSKEFVFVTRDGKRYSESTFLRYLTLAKKLAGIDRRFRAHDLRHTFGSRLATEGVPTSDIATALGHTSERMAARYSRSAPSATLDRIRAALTRNVANSPANSPALPGTGNAPAAALSDCVAREYMERATRVELATSSLGSWRSTN